MASLFLWLLIGICGRGFEAADPVNSQRISFCPMGIRIRINDIAFSYIFQADSTIHAETAPLRWVATPRALSKHSFADRSRKVPVPARALTRSPYGGSLVSDSITEQPYCMSDFVA